MDIDNIFEFVFELAFRDATMRKAFPKQAGDTPDYFQYRKSESRRNAKDTVKEFINNLLDGGQPVCPEEYIFKICRNTCEYGFTFGNAQKLINMVAKYMFIICYDDITKRYKFQNCHCPMDGIMIQMVKNKGMCIDIPSDFPWSKMVSDGKSIPKEYQMFQETIRSLCKEDELPIEYDFEQWLVKE